MVELFQDWGGAAFVFAAAAIAVIFPGLGSAKGVGLVGQAGTGLLSEEPTKFSKVLVLEILPSTQGLYGFIATILLLISAGVMSGDVSSVSVGTGVDYFMAALPIAVVGYFSAVHQGKTAASGVAIVAKQPEHSTKAIVLAAMVETYAVLALLVSLLAIFNVK